MIKLNKMGPLMLSLVLLVAFLTLFAYGQSCQTKMTVRQVVMPSPQYNACYSSMRATFSSQITQPGAYDVVRCVVEGCGYQKDYYVGEFPNDGPITKTEWFQCASQANHRIYMDVTPQGEVERGFSWPYSFKVEYMGENQDGPQGP